MPVLFEKTVGTREEVYRGIAEKTSYNADAMRKEDIVYAPGGSGSPYKSKYKVQHVPPQLKKWTKAVKKAKKELGIKKDEMALVKGKLATATRKFYSA